MEVVAQADFVHIGGFYLMPKFDGPDTVKALQCAKQSGAVTTMDILGVQQENMAEKYFHACHTLITLCRIWRRRA